jgi:hypothetical protein
MRERGSQRRQSGAAGVAVRLSGLNLVLEHSVALWLSCEGSPP